MMTDPHLIRDTHRPFAIYYSYDEHKTQEFKCHLHHLRTLFSRRIMHTKIHLEKERLRPKPVTQRNPLPRNRSYSVCLKCSRVHDPKQVTLAAQHLDEVTLVLL